MFLDARMRLWYWLLKYSKEDQSRAQWVRFQRFSILSVADRRSERSKSSGEIETLKHSYTETLIRSHTYPMVLAVINGTSMISCDREQHLPLTMC